MCVTNVYVDQYPDGKQVEFRQTSYCKYGQPMAGRPCQKLSTLENPVRNIQFGEPTTQYMMTAHQRVFPHTPPRSSGGSHHRYSGGESGSEGHRRRSSRRRSEHFTLKPTRQHKKERIVIVDSPPTPRTPPQVYRDTFTAPSSPASPFIIDGLPRRERGRAPIIVDERSLHRLDSIGAVIGPRRARSQSRTRFQWDSPSSSHTSFDSRARREAEEIQLLEERRRREERDERIAYLEAERRREERIKRQDEEIRRRPPVPFPPAPLRQRQLRPVIDQTQALLGGLSLNGRTGERVLLAEVEERRWRDERDRALRARMVVEEEEALKQRLRERQMPKRRSSVGPGARRHRVIYDDGVYRWE